MKVSNFTGRVSRRFIIVGVFALALSACGGGGGGGGGGGAAPFPSAPTTALTITSANAAAVAGESADALLQSVGAGSEIVGAKTTGPSAAPQVVTRVLRISAKVVSPLLSDSPQIAAGAALDSSSCTFGGSVTAVQNSSTSATLTFNDCQDISGEVINGQVRVTGINGTSMGGAISFTANLSADLTAATTGLPDVRTAGDFVLDFSDNGAGSVSIGIRGPNSRLALDDGSHTIVMTNLDVTAFTAPGSDLTIIGSFDLASTRLNGMVSVNTTTSLSLGTGDEKPSSGKITVLGVGSGLQIIIHGNENAAQQVHIDLDLNGDGTFGGAEDGTSIDDTWADLDAA